MDLMTDFIILFLVGFSFDTISASMDSIEAKIVGGNVANIKEYPYMAFLLLSEITGQQFRCGGSIISNLKVLTAAHCIVNIHVLTVRIGSSLAHSGGFLYQVHSYDIHPNYDATSIDYDIGIVTVTEPMKLKRSFPRAVPLIEAGRVIAPRTLINITGWGRIDDNIRTDHLMSTTVPTLSNSDCRKIRKNVGKRITDRMLCAGYADGKKNTCNGDSGGPAVSKGTQIGIVSFGNKSCNARNSPSVYTNITHPAIRNWITKQMNANFAGVKEWSSSKF